MLEHTSWIHIHPRAHIQSTHARRWRSRRHGRGYVRRHGGKERRMGRGDHRLHTANNDIAHGEETQRAREQAEMGESGDRQNKRSVHIVNISCAHARQTSTAHSKTLLLRIRTLTLPLSEWTLFLPSTLPRLLFLSLPLPLSLRLLLRGESPTAIASNRNLRRRALKYGRYKHSIAHKRYINKRAGIRSETGEITDKKNEQSIHMVNISCAHAHCLSHALWQVYRLTFFRY